MLSTTQSDEERFETALGADDEAPLRWERRVFMVALFGLAPGVQLGCIIALCFSLNWPTYYVAMALGGVLGMIAAGLLEADHWL
jgi:hypothetical protein